MNIRSIAISDYTYTLAAEKIAHHPLPDRDASRLLVWKDGIIQEDTYRNISDWLPAASMLTFNDTRVIAARLHFQKPSGGVIEIFCLEPGDEYSDISTAMLQQGSVVWKCLIGGASKWKAGQVLEKQIAFEGRTLGIQARYLGKQNDSFIIGLSWQPEQCSFAEVLNAFGSIPLPPYLHRTAEAEDTERYQTVYAQHNGSVAAPTAGLHFTSTVFDKLVAKKIVREFVTLHVGAGTFKPVKAASLDEHDMHAEFIDVRRDTIEHLLHFTGNQFAVGTTSARTLESLYWMGVKTCIDPTISPANLSLSQWEVYETLPVDRFDKATALRGLLEWMERHELVNLVTKTQLLIAPGYDFKMIDGLVTNFHQPQSTLLLLVAALIGEDWKNVYTYALDHSFRFLSYGDGCLLFRKPTAAMEDR